MTTQIKITECPRDAMQGFTNFIPTDVKIAYINQLLKVGFDVIDFGSFVSPKAVPQMRDTEDVAAGLELSSTNSKLLSIIGNAGGAERAEKFDFIKFLGYPHSVSNTFLQRNINSNIEDSLNRIREIQNRCEISGKSLLVYISMAFGNPYNDPWNDDLVASSVEDLVKEGVRYIALSDTIGEAQPENISYLFKHLIPQFPGVEFGAHFHTTPKNWHHNVTAAYESGCRKFDSALMGFGGCPMAKDELTGNLPTENLLSFCDENQLDSGIQRDEFLKAMAMAPSVFHR
jgi:hydroxymethylglutaryl-CoA lyase